MDPLALLREYCIGNKLDSVVRNGSRIDFGDLYSFEGSTLTRFRSRGGHYTLGAIYFFVKNRKVPYGQYFQNAKKENWETVAVVDKRALIDYLEGKTGSCPQIDTSMANAPMVSQKRSAENAKSEEAGRKLQRIEGVDDKSVDKDDPEKWTIDQIYAQEKTKFRPADCLVT